MNFVSGEKKGKYKEKANQREWSRLDFIRWRLMFKTKKKIICPFCKEEVTLKIQMMVLKNFISSFYSPHIHLHGNPLHALVCYINKDLQVKNLGIIRNIEMSKDSETLTQLIQKWSNPH